MGNPIVVKSRNLPLTDFYSVLQREFISYFIRSKIYPPEYAKKYAKYCECKRDKIEKIGMKNSLPSIFNVESLKTRYIENFFNAYGLPNFEYRDETSIKIMGKWDKIYFFSEGTSIKVKTEKGTTLTIVDKNLFSVNKVVATVDGETRQFGYESISRIITEGLISF